MLANFAKYKGKVDRFCLIEPGEVQTVAEAVAILEKEKAAGAIGMGEHYGRGLMFDDPKNLLLFEACEKVGLPVHFHIDNNKNMDEKGLPRLERVLKMYPKCKLIAHAQFWLHLPDGTCDRLLQTYPNLYAEPSGLRMAAVLNRDRKYTREFLIRNADKILFGTDAGWWSFGGGPGNREIQFQLFEELDLPVEVKEKIYHKNAEKLFGFSND
jgi:predicted TIM-barrel fold metal-dependent hydrolase